MNEVYLKSEKCCPCGANPGSARNLYLQFSKFRGSNPDTVCFDSQAFTSKERKLYFSLGRPLNKFARVVLGGDFNCRTLLGNDAMCGFWPEKEHETFPVALKEFSDRRFSTCCRRFCIWSLFARKEPLQSFAFEGEVEDHVVIL